MYVLIIPPCDIDIICIIHEFLSYCVWVTVSVQVVIDLWVVNTPPQV